MEFIMPRLRVVAIVDISDFGAVEGRFSQLLRLEED
jgi:hypothetical protein